MDRAVDANHFLMLGTVMLAPVIDLFERLTAIFDCGARALLILRITPRFAAFP